MNSNYQILKISKLKVFILRKTLKYSLCEKGENIEL
jgi:hypothetical protein